MKKSDITGSGGAVPPPDAPRETAQPLQPDTLAIQQANARANERELKPFNPPAVRQALPPTAPMPKPAAPPATPTDALIADVFGADAPDPLGTLDPAQGEVEQIADVLPELTPEDRLRMPAASNTDTPAKGLLPNLTPTAGDKFDGIQRGGFSDVGEAQYFPLSGDELRQLVLALFDTIAQQIQNDLRFSMALTYPRVRAIVEVRVEGHAEDDNAGFEITKIKEPKEGEAGGTALEVARARANEVVFVVQAFRQEFTPGGESDQPPDALRDELGLAKPRKQMVDSAGRPTFVDVVMGGEALTR